jgi:hypothetical protein
MSAADVARRLYERDDSGAGLTLPEIERAAVEADCDPRDVLSGLFRLRELNALKIGYDIGASGTPVTWAGA